MPRGKLSTYRSIESLHHRLVSVVFEFNSVDWNAGQADVRIKKSLIVDEPGTPSSFPAVESVSRKQPIASWTQPDHTQIHGPRFRPRSPFSYATIWTENRIIAFNSKTNNFVPLSPFSFGTFSQQTHGLAFNARGTLALGTGYYYDQSSIDLYGFIPGVAVPVPLYLFELRHRRKNGAFTHYTVWLNNRYVYTATQQFGKTSSTPWRTKISGPWIWLLDLLRLRATRVVGTARNVHTAGVLRSASDVNIANGKLYVAEEDTLDKTHGQDGFVSIFDTSTPTRPKFVKRLKPGNRAGKNLPKDFAVAYGLTTTPDQRFVMVPSYASDYTVKIDTVTDRVTKVWDQRMVWQCRTADSWRARTARHNPKGWTSHRRASA